MIITINSNPVKVNTLKRLKAEAYLRHGYMLAYNINTPDNITAYTPEEVNWFDREHKARNKAIEKQADQDRFNDSLALLASLVEEQALTA